MEFSLIDRIRARTALARADVPLGIGDDAALLAPPPGTQIAVAIDTLVAGVHFPLDTDPAAIGWKALAVNLSDLAAMGAQPAWALLALTLPSGDAAFIDGLADGFARLAQQHQLALVGGDTTRGPLCLSVAVHGLLPVGQGLLRSAAQVGDLVCVTGTLGDAAGGLRCVQTQALADPAAQALRERLDRPTPRVQSGLVLRDLAHACIDVSDGLLADLAHICKASAVGAQIDLDALPLSAELLACFAHEQAQHFALSGGDDYELCFTIAPEQFERAQALSETPLTAIGRIVEGGDIRVLDAQGQAISINRPGWDHFGA